MQGQNGVALVDIHDLVDDCAGGRGEVGFAAARLSAPRAVSSFSASSASLAAARRRVRDSSSETDQIACPTRSLRSDALGRPAAR